MLQDQSTGHAESDLVHETVCHQFVQFQVRVPQDTELSEPAVPIVQDQAFVLSQDGEDGAEHEAVDHQLDQSHDQI